MNHPEFAVEIDVHAPAPLSGDIIGKRKRKRLAKLETIREKRDETKRLKAVAKAATEASSSSKLVSSVYTEEERRERKETQIQDYEALCKSNFSVIIDCDWESAHTDKALNSLSQQIMYSYSLSKKSSNPCFIYLTGVGDRLLGKLSKVESRNWMGVNMQSESYSCLGLSKELVYLTSDAEDTLENLNPNCAYIIGGIVDRNALKGATFKKASAEGIKTAKLPIREYCSMKSTPVLTVNHVFDILLAYSRCHSWPESFQCILPKRKAVSVLEATIECADACAGKDSSKNLLQPTNR